MRRAGWWLLTLALVILVVGTLVVAAVGSELLQILWGWILLPVWPALVIGVILVVVGHRRAERSNAMALKSSGATGTEVLIEARQSTEERLNALDRLRSAGKISPSEYSEQRKRILDCM